MAPVLPRRQFGEGRAARYASSLLEIAEASAAADGVLAILPSTERHMKERIALIMKATKTSRALLCAAAFACVPPKREAPQSETPADAVSPAAPVSSEENAAEGWLFPFPDGTDWILTGTVAPDETLYVPDKEDPSVTAALTIPHCCTTLAAPAGTPVFAMRTGTIAEAEYDWKRGWYAVVDCGDALYELSHLSSISPCSPAIRSRRAIPSARSARAEWSAAPASASASGRTGS